MRVEKDTLRRLRSPFALAAVMLLFLVSQGGQPVKANAQASATLVITGRLVDQQGNAISEAEGF